MACRCEDRSAGRGRWPVAPTLAVGTAAAVLLGGCAGSSSGVGAAPSAGSSACTTALAAAPAAVLGSSRSTLAVAGALAWGRPAIVARCGLPEQPPTTKPCLTVNDVDWIVDDSGDPIVFTAYGRAPTLEVRVPLSYGRQNATSALVPLAGVARALPKTSHACIG